jgi:hypothetical protein
VLQALLVRVLREPLVQEQQALRVLQALLVRQVEL